MRFVQSGLGFVNLEHVAYAAPGHTDKLEGLTKVELYGPGEDQHLGTTLSYQLSNLLEIPLATVADTSGTLIVQVLFDPDGTANAFRYPVFAWHVFEQHAVPVTCDAISDSDDSTFLELPESCGPCRWVRPGYGAYSSFEAAVADLHRRPEAREST
jgi:hypothetical protein